MTGVAAMLLGLVVLVLTGVGLSLVRDKHVDFSRQQDEQEESTSHVEARLQFLRDSLKAQTGLLDAQVARQDNIEAEYKAIISRIAAAKAGRDRLNATKASVGEILLQLPGQFESYRKSYRQQAWQAAIGERHPSIKLLSGRVFDNVVIKRVTDVGLEISHQAGIARIDANDLDDSWRQRFQWEQTQRQAMIEKENQALQMNINAHPEAPPQPVSAVTREATTPSSPAAPIGPGVRDLDRLRASIIHCKGKISTLQTEYGEARHNMSYGKSRSVPGSLESWDSKAARVEVDLTRARASLQLAIARLAAASPNDPLLHTQPGSP